MSVWCALLVQRPQAGVAASHPSLSLRRACLGPHAPCSDRSVLSVRIRPTRAVDTSSDQSAERRRPNPKPTPCGTTDTRQGLSRTAMVRQRSERGSCGADAAGFQLGHRMLPGGVWLRRVSLVDGGCALPPYPVSMSHHTPLTSLPCVGPLLHHRFANLIPGAT